MRADLERDALAIQAEILDLAENVWDLAPTDLARQMATKSSTVRSWRCETSASFRGMPVAALLHLCRIRRDPIAVLQPLLAKFGLVAVRHHSNQADEAHDVHVMSLLGSASLGRINALVAKAIADGKIDDHERAPIAQAIRDHIAQWQATLAQVEDRPTLVEASKQ